MQLTFFGDILDNNSGAIIDDTERYRYSLWRVWDDTLPRVTFIMLNPSTADSREDDPTLRRCIKFAMNWGYGSLEVVNLFAYRSTNPEMLLSANDPIGKENNQYIVNALTRSEKVILAWGTKGILFDRDKEVLNLIRQNSIPLFVLELTKDGHPRHPLYVKANKIPELYK
ncbi:MULTISPECIES: DUF1643 domain-containing protein [Lysinibacillus]|uniref:DUF1643 domain-containing protein n=1 Tax=Lysinibacillus capsici TaxID=2115968 RepID=A0ABY8KIK2_9BACI|nr:DUF1643 domain-containing protein [Lysinibacillus capsici]WGF39324.1 DUF1643 domain-containing protein [Lysinibacillus capsici]